MSEETSYSSPTSASSHARAERAHILVAEDDAALRNLLVMSLENIGYRVSGAVDGAQALDLFLKEPVDLVILDIMMPNMSGLEVLEEIRRRSNVPVIMLTALNRPEDVVVGLEKGADDYIPKPFTFKEVEARVKAVLRRVRWLKEARPPAILHGCGVRVDAALRRVYVDERPVDLSLTEFDLLYYLLSHRGRPVPKEELFREVWGYEYTGASNVVEVAIRRLRSKVERNPARPRRILTVRGIGYKFATEDECAEEEEREGQDSEGRT